MTIGLQSGRGPLFTPTLGILTEIGPRTDEEGLSWPDYAYAHVNRVCAESGAPLCLFAPPDIDWSSGTVTAWIDPEGRGRWFRRPLPMPRGVYNRISRRKTESLPACQRLLDRLSRSRPVLNPRFVDKWETHRAIVRSDARMFAPRAVLVDAPSALLSAVRRFGDAYVKPAAGSLGRGVARLRTVSDGFLLEQNGAFREPVRTERLREKDALGRVESWTRRSAWIVQETVPKATFHGRPFDLRILVQRDETGAWSMTGAAGRVVGEGQLTSHTLRGGRRIGMERLRSDAVPPPPPDDVLDEMARRAAAAVECGLGLFFFEFSLDVAVARDGRPYILEINSKPFPFDEADIRRRAAMRLVNFFRRHAPQPRRGTPYAGTGRLGS